MKIDAVSFDLWFTLIWSDDTILEEYTGRRVSALYAGLKESGAQLSIKDVEKLYSYTSHFRMILPPRETIKFLIYAAGLKAGDDVVDKIWMMYENSTCNVKPHLNPESIDSLDYLREKGYRMGIISNTSFSEEGLIRILKNIGLDAYFEVVISSSSEGVKKPFPRIFDILADRLGVEKARIVHIGDKYMDDVIGAYLAGLKGILYRGLWDKYKVYKEFRKEQLIEFCPRKCMILDDLRMIKKIL